MSEDSNEDDFCITKWMSLSGISEGGCKKIILGSIDDLSTLLLMQPSDIDLLKLNVGDAIRIKAGIAKLHAVQDKPPALHDADGNVVKKTEGTVSSAKVKDIDRVYSQLEVEQLLAGREAVSAGQGVNAVAVPGAGRASGVLGSAIGTSLAALFSKPADSTISDLRELMRDLLGLDDSQVPRNSKGEKALLPVNFLSCIRGSQDAEEIIHSGKGLNLVLQSASRIKPERLTTGQWVSANSRILEKLVASGKLTASGLTDYLDYVRKIGDLLQLFTPGSVFTLDHNHRLEVHEKDTKRWNEVDCTLEISHLKRKDDVSHLLGGASKGGATGGNARDNDSGKRVQQKHVHSPCWAFNSADGCKYTKQNCRYEHVESLERNPRTSGFAERAPRFQKGATGT
jgi:hypothetical protein